MVSVTDPLLIKTVGALIDESDGIAYELSPVPFRVTVSCGVTGSFDAMIKDLVKAPVLSGVKDNSIPQKFVEGDCVQLWLTTEKLAPVRDTLLIERGSCP
jgi:hypothetical protein